MTPEELKQLEELGVDLLSLPKVHDEASLFDFVFTVMRVLSSAIDQPTPTYDQVYKAVEESREKFNF